MTERVNISEREEGHSMRGRTQSVYVRRQEDCAAMAWQQRWKTRISTSLGRRHRHNKTDAVAGVPVVDPSSNSHADDVEWQPDGAGAGTTGTTTTTHPPRLQYRLLASTVRNQLPVWKRILACCCYCGNTFQNNAAIGRVAGMNPNQSLAMYLHWMFRANFAVLFGIMCTMFFTLVIFFAGIITAAGTLDDECVRIGGDVFDAQNTAFADAFSLSWTTFSTVGYGSTAPALGHQNDSPTNCFFINFICSMESLIGVLYSGFCGAILFGKVLRIQSQAQVIFSDPIVIRFGSGVSDVDGGRAAEASTDTEKKIPCPVLEFRIANRLFNEVGGEIMDATLNVVANVDAVDSDTNASETASVSGASSSQFSSNSSDNGSIGKDESTLTSEGTRIVSKLFDPLWQFGRGQNMVIEDPTSRLVTKHIFSKMSVEAGDHPFFKRVWLARHVLDEHSPIVKPRVRRLIRKNGGFWPTKLNKHEAVRNSLKFNQILVSLNGVSNVSASDVYAQKIYDFVDINIGYQFVNILYREADGTLGVDTDLINDVREQNGGGGEPLVMEDS